MATVVEVHAAIKTRVTNGGLAFAVRWPNDNDADLVPDTPTAFALIEVRLDKPELIAVGGGVGQNLYRTTGEIVAHISVPRDGGLAPALTYGEAFAALFRGYRDATINCFAAGTDPEAEQIDGNYYVIPATVDFHFDQFG